MFSLINYVIVILILYKSVHDKLEKDDLSMLIVRLTTVSQYPRTNKSYLWRKLFDVDISVYILRWLKKNQSFIVRLIY